jgi:hypothetical protein
VLSIDGNSSKQGSIQTAACEKQILCESSLPRAAAAAAAGACRQLRCPAGSAKAGELDVAHMNSFSHATNYPPIILSGLVDLINAHWVPLPQGTVLCLTADHTRSAVC